MTSREQLLKEIFYEENLNDKEFRAARTMVWANLCWVILMRVWATRIALSLARLAKTFKPKAREYSSLKMRN
jgi:hypothetical protein